MIDYIIVFYKEVKPFSFSMILPILQIKDIGL